MELVSSSLPDDYAHRTLEFVAKQLGSSPHVEFYLKWACSILSIHGPKDQVLSHHSLLALHQNLSRKYEMLSKVCDFNKYTIKVLKSMATKKSEENGSEMEDDDDDTDDEELLMVRTNGHDIDVDMNDVDNSSDSD